MTQPEIAALIDKAVDVWHEVADEHEIAHCNCFREAFARRLIDSGVYVGYDKLDAADREVAWRRLFGA